VSGVENRGDGGRRVRLLRSLIFTSILFVSVPVYCVPVILCAPLPYRVRFAIVRSWAHMVMASLQVLCGLRYVVEGREHLPPRPCVVLLKHQSAWETIAEVLFIPDQSWVLKRELMWAPFLGWALAALRPIAIDRRAHRTALDQVVEQGGSAWQPACGSWSFRKARASPRARGRATGWAARRSRRLRACRSCPWPTTPAGTGAVVRGVKYPGTIRVRIGPAIAPEDLTVPALTEVARNWIEGAVAELDAAARAEVGALVEETAARGEAAVGAGATASDVEVSHGERVALDELAPRLYLVAHERREDLVR
jgi:1-acyl-sn-glycerol-3-phosphate acyltransferase